MDGLEHDPVRITEHGGPESVDPPGHPLLTMVGVLLLLALLALGSLALGRSLGADDGAEVAVVVIPRGNGRSAAEVQQQLERLGLFVEIRYASNETAPPDTVTAQSPVAGSRLEVGKLVTLTVSDGPAGIRVPDAAGFQPLAAANLLQAVGLTTSTEEVYDDKVRVGEVVATEPEAGARAAVGSNVVLKLSKGPRPRTIPAVVGLDQAHAFALIAAGELQIGTIKSTVTGDSPDGTVLSTSPEAGSEVPPATPINLVIAQAPAPLTVPDLTLMTRASANSLATNVGLKLRFESVPVPLGDGRAGIVLSQTPLAGSILEKGATVNVTIGLAPTPTTTTVAPTTTVAGGG